MDTPIIRYKIEIASDVRAYFWVLYKYHEYHCYSLPHVIAGLPEAPVFAEESDTFAKKYQLSWTCTTYSPVLKYRMQYRKVQVHITQYILSLICLNRSILNI